MWYSAVSLSPLCKYYFVVHGMCAINMQLNDFHENFLPVTWTLIIYVKTLKESDMRLDVNKFTRLKGTAAVGNSGLQQ